MLCLEMASLCAYNITAALKSYEHRRLVLARLADTTSESF